MLTVSWIVWHTDVNTMWLWPTVNFRKAVIRHVWSNELHAVPMMALMGAGCLLLMLACWLSDCESDDEWREKERELEERERENSD